MNDNFHILTERLTIRRFRADSEAEIRTFEEHFASDESFQELAAGKPNSKAERVVFLAELCATPRCYAIEENALGLVGYVALNARGRTGSIEYYIFPEYRRRGYCKEAVRALIGDMFDGSGRLNAIKARVGENNLPSVRVLESLGFRFLGSDRKKLEFWDGRRVAVRRYMLARPEKEQ